MESDTQKFKKKKNRQKHNIRWTAKSAKIFVFLLHVERMLYCLGPVGMNYCLSQQFWPYQCHDSCLSCGYFLCRRVIKVNYMIKSPCMFCNV